jgi:hypothetical protein
MMTNSCLTPICSFFNDAFSVRHYSIERQEERWTMNWKGCGRMRSWPNFRSNSGIRLGGGGLVKITKISMRTPVSGPRFESATSRIWSKSVNRSTTKFDVNWYQKSSLVNVISVQQCLSLWATVQLNEERRTRLTDEHFEGWVRIVTRH